MSEKGGNIKLKSFLLISFILFFVSHCLKNPYTSDSKFSLNDTLSVNYHETLYNSDLNISIKFNVLNSDGRCPIGRMCIWEGNAAVTFLFYDDGDVSEVLLNTCHIFRTDTLINGYNIELIDLLPYPKLNSTYAAEDYKAVIKISK